MVGGRDERRERLIPLFGWKEEGRERRSEGRESPSKPVNLNKSITFYAKVCFTSKRIIKKLYQLVI